MITIGSAMASTNWTYKTYTWQRTTHALLLRTWVVLCLVLLTPALSHAQNEQHLADAIKQHRQSGQKDSSYVRLLFAAVEDLNLVDQAPQNFEEACALLPRVRTPLLDADFLYAAGTLARIQNRLNAAADTFRLALNRYAALGEKEKVVLVYSRLGLLYQQQGIYEAAIDYHITALSLAEEISYTDLIFRQNINLASLYNHLNKSLKALNLLNTAERIMPADAAAQRRVALFLYKADSYSRLGNIDSAKTSLVLALAITYKSPFKDTALLAYLYSSYAVIAQKAGESVLAQSMLDTALAMEYALKPVGYYSIRPLMDAARVMSLRAEQLPGQSAQKSDLYRRAIAYAHRAASVPTGFRLYPLWLKEILVKSYAALGDHAMAYQMQREYISLSDSLFSIGLEKHIETVQEHIALTKREREIERLTNDNRAYTRLQYVLMLGAATLLALILVLWNRYRFQQRSEHLVEHINKELQGSNGQLIQANELLHRTNEELSLAKERVEEVNRMKRAFLDTISHEIRTPLTAIQGYSQLLSIMLTNTEHVEFAERIHDSGEHLLLLFEDMLYLSKMQGDQVQIDLQPTSLHDLCRQVCAMFEEPARLKGVALTSTVSTVLVKHLPLDTAKIRLILFNLIGNAVKFTDEGFVRLDVEPILTTETLEIGNDAHVKGIRITVTDTGIGIAHDAIGNIFDSFRQSAEIHRKYGGLGLGLTICKNFIDILGGSISAESAQGQGSTFIVELPVSGGY